MQDITFSEKCLPVRLNQNNPSINKKQQFCFKIKLDRFVISWIEVKDDESANTSNKNEFKTVPPVDSIFIKRSFIFFCVRQIKRDSSGNCKKNFNNQYKHHIVVNGVLPSDHNNSKHNIKNYFKKCAKVFATPFSKRT